MDHKPLSFDFKSKIAQMEWILSQSLNFVRFLGGHRSHQLGQKGNLEEIQRSWDIEQNCAVNVAHTFNTGRGTYPPFYNYAANQH